MFKAIAKAPLRLLLSNRRVAEIVAWEASRIHYHLDEVRLPLTHGLTCPIPDPEAVYSFSEIFVSREYGPMFDIIPAPVRWIDLGCHCGYFSLFLEWSARRAGFGEERKALLVDGDPRWVECARRVLKSNNLTGSFELLHGAIAAGSGEVSFGQRAFMASSLASVDNTPSKIVRVPILEPAAIAAALPPPYDLVKVDIEGAEIEFLNHYRCVINESNALLVEWHSWNSAGADGDAFAALVARIGFANRKTMSGPAEVRHRSGLGRCGVELFWRH